MVNDTHTRRKRRLDQHVQAGLGMLNEVRIFELRLKYLDSNSFFAPFIFDSEFFLVDVNIRHQTMLFLQ